MFVGYIIDTYAINIFKNAFRENSKRDFSQVIKAKGKQVKGLKYV